MSDEQPWETRFRQAFEKLNEAGKLEGFDEAAMIADLRRDTLLTFRMIHDAAVETGDPEYLLKMIRQGSRLAGLESSTTNVNLMGGSDNLPDLSHLSAEDLAQLTQATPIAALPPPVDHKVKVKRGRKPKDTDADTD